MVPQVQQKVFSIQKEAPLKEPHPTALHWAAGAQGGAAPSLLTQHTPVPQWVHAHVEIQSDAVGIATQLAKASFRRAKQ